MVSSIFLKNAAGALGGEPGGICEATINIANICEPRVKNFPRHQDAILFNDECALESAGEGMPRLATESDNAVQHAADATGVGKKCRYASASTKPLPAGTNVIHSPVGQRIRRTMTTPASAIEDEPSDSQSRSIHSSFRATRCCVFCWSKRRKCGAQRSGMTQSVLSPSDAAWAKNRQGGDGAETGGTPVLDVAEGMELPAVDEVRFARGRARTSRWCAVQHRVIDWASGGVRSSNHDRKCDRRDGWVGPSLLT